MKIFFIGDIYGRVGRKVLIDHLTKINIDKKIDFIVANGENATNGKSLSLPHYQILKKVGINVFTMGNHIFSLSETLNELNNLPDLLRPFNYDYLPGLGTNVFKCGDLSIRITNLSGRTFMSRRCSNPFHALEKIVKSDQADLHFVDFHAEATAEKIALAWAFDGKITGLLGTHTHVPTADARLLPKKTFFISDLGMTGPHDSIIGAEPESIIFGQVHDAKFQILPAKGRAQISGIIVEINHETKKVIKWEQIYQIFDN